MKYSAKIAMNRRGDLRRLFRNMPIKDVALVLYEQSELWVDQVFEAVMIIQDNESGPQDDDHLNWHGQNYSPPTDEMN